VKQSLLSLAQVSFGGYSDSRSLSTRVLGLFWHWLWSRVCSRSLRRRWMRSSSWKHRWFLSRMPCAVEEMRRRPRSRCVDRLCSAYLECEWPRSRCVDRLYLECVLFIWNVFSIHGMCSQYISCVLNICNVFSMYGSIYMECVLYTWNVFSIYCTCSLCMECVLSKYKSSQECHVLWICKEGTGPSKNLIFF